MCGATQFGSTYSIAAAKACIYVETASSRQDLKAFLCGLDERWYNVDSSNGNPTCPSQLPAGVAGSGDQEIPSAATWVDDAKVSRRVGNRFGEPCGVSRRCEERSEYAAVAKRDEIA